jgi:zinc protease
MIGRFGVWSPALLGLWLLQNLALGAAPDRSSPSTPVFPFPIHQSVLDNGLRVISVPFDSPGIVAYYTVVRTGSRNEVEEGLSGFAHFFEHMMFRGTERFPQEKYNSILKTLGADSNAFTTDDWTCYHLTVPSSALATVVEIEADRFQNLKYDEPAFQKEARAVLGEYNKSASSPFLKLEEALQETAFTTHTYRHTTLGFLQDIEAMPRQYGYSKVFFDRWYRPDNCVIVVAGDVRHDELIALVQTHYAAWKPGAAVLEIPSEPPQTEPRSKALSWPLPTLPILCLAYHIPAWDPANPETAALAVLEQLLFGTTSTLYKELVLEKQTVVDLSVFTSPHRDPFLFPVVARLRDSADLPTVRSRITAAFADAARDPVEPARLSAVKSHLRYAFAASLTSADAVAAAVSESLAITNRPDSMNQFYEVLDRIESSDVQRVAARYFIATNETMITLEPEPKR